MKGQLQDRPLERGAGHVRRERRVTHGVVERPARGGGARQLREGGDLVPLSADESRIDDRTVTRNDRAVDAGEHPVQRCRPAQRIGVAEARRRAFLHEVAGEEHPGGRYRHNDVAVGMTETVVRKNDGPSAHLEGDGVVDHRVRRGDLHRLDRSAELVPLRILASLCGDTGAIGGSPIAQSRCAAAMTPDPRRAERRIAEGMVEMGMGVDDDPRMRRDVPDRVDEIARLTFMATGVDDEAGVVTDDESAV